MTTISTGIHGVDQQLLQNYQRSNDRTQTSVERLSTGKRINRPKDDPPGFIAAEGLRKELSNLERKLGSISTERQQSHVQQSGLANIQSVLIELRGRLVSAADGTISDDERAALAAEIDNTAEAVNRIAKLTGATDAIDFNIAMSPLSANPDAAQLVDDKSRGVADQRTALAAHERTHLDTFEELYKDQIVITTEALSQVEDTDFAAESANLVQSQILSQGAMAALAYSSRQRTTQLTLLLDAIA
jgi:flagellin-like hook-associated protein FlgL